MDRIINQYDRPGLDVIDPGLLEALRNGSHEAFEAIYLRSINPMIDFLYLLLRSRDEAEEVAQDIFVKLWENRGKINPRANFKGYLFTIAKYTAFDNLSHRKVEAKYQKFKMSMTEEYESSPDHHIISSELFMLMRLCIEKMPEQQRRVFEMSRVEGLDSDEIATRLNISKNTVWVHLHNAMKDLKQLISIFTFLFLY